MNRKINKVEVSGIFWDDIGKLRRESWYPDVRNAIAKFVTDVSAGMPVRERGFSNPNLKGVMHLRLPHDLRLFHVYPEEGLLRLCLVADHKVYGFKGKNKSREAKTADRIWKSASEPAKKSPEWDAVKWQSPDDLIENPEIVEMSVKGLHELSLSILKESDDFEKLMRFSKVSSVDDVPMDVLEPWLEDLIEAQDIVYEVMNTVCDKRRSPLDFEDFQPWM